MVTAVATGMIFDTAVVFAGCGLGVNEEVTSGRVTVEAEVGTTALVVTSDSGFDVSLIVAVDWNCCMAAACCKASGTGDATEVAIAVAVIDAADCNSERRISRSRA